MNCKQGDLAVVVNARAAENNGRIVKVLELAAPGDWVAPSGHSYVVESEPTWLVKSCDGDPFASVTLSGRRVPGDPIQPFRDCALRPIRPPAQGDQVTSLVGKPEKVTA